MYNPYSRLVFNRINENCVRVSYAHTVYRNTVSIKTMAQVAEPNQFLYNVGSLTSNLPPHLGSIVAYNMFLYLSPEVDWVKRRMQKKRLEQVERV